MHTDSSSSGSSYCCLGSHQTGLSSETGSTLRKEIFLRDNIFSKMLKQARICEDSMVGKKIFNLFLARLCASNEPRNEEIYLKYMKEILESKCYESADNEKSNQKAPNENKSILEYDSESSSSLSDDDSSYRSHMGTNISHLKKANEMNKRINPLSNIRWRSNAGNEQSRTNEPPSNGMYPDDFRWAFV